MMNNMMNKMNEMDICNVTGGKLYGPQMGRDYPVGNQPFGPTIDENGNVRFGITTPYPGPVQVETIIDTDADLNNQLLFR